MRTLLLSILFFTACNMLSGCYPLHVPHRTVKTTAMPPPNASLAADINQQGAQIIQEGQHLQIILPIDTFFRGTTFEIQEGQVETLHTIARYLRQFSDQFAQTPLIIISGHTDWVFDRQIRLQRSKQYAETVASFLWNDGFNRKQLQVRAYGAQQPIANPKTMAGSSENRRVVIQIG